MEGDDAARLWRDGVPERRRDGRASDFKLTLSPRTDDRLQNASLYVCSYNPPGNYIGEFGENVQP